MLSRIKQPNINWALGCFVVIFIEKELQDKLNHVINSLGLFELNFKECNKVSCDTVIVKFYLDTRGRQTGAPLNKLNSNQCTQKEILKKKRYFYLSAS